LGTSFPNHSIGLAVPPWVSPKQERGKTEVEKTDPKQQCIRKHTAEMFGRIEAIPVLWNEDGNLEDYTLQQD
jgi:hypothetical protein